MPATAKKYQHVAVIFGKLSYSQGESPKKTVKSGSNSFHRICWRLLEDQQKALADRTKQQTNTFSSADECGDVVFHDKHFFEWLPAIYSRYEMQVNKYSCHKRRKQLQCLIKCCSAKKDCRLSEIVLVTGH